MNTHYKNLYKFYWRKLRISILQGLMYLAVLLAKFNIIFKKHEPKPKRILVIVFGGLGDCLLFDVLLRRIREHYREKELDIQIDVLTGSFEKMWQASGSADNILIFSRFSWKFPLGYLRLFYMLRKNNYDIAIEGIAMLPRRGVWSVLTGLFIKAAGAKENIVRQSTGVLQMTDMPFAGFKSASKVNKLQYRIFNNQNVKLIQLPHPSQRDYHEAYYVAQALNIEFHRPNNEPCLFINKTNPKEFGLSDHKIKIAILIETTYPLKAWPAQNYIELINRLGQHQEFQIVLLGVEALPVNVVNNLPNVDTVNLCAATNLEELMQVISCCDLFIGADTGPAHIAQALGIASVIMFGPSNEKEFGPVNQDLHALILPEKEFECRPCVLGPCIKEQSCMHAISVTEVYNKALNLMARKAHWHHAPRYTVPKNILKV